MHSSPFTVAGISASTSTHHSHGTNAWGGASSGGPLTTLSDTLSQSRTQYQPGYMLSASQNNALPQGSQRVDEAPIVQTKAQMNHALLRGSASEFGMDSMFESSRQRNRQTFTDEDAPPTNSVNDIPTEFHSESSSTRLKPTASAPNNSPFQMRHSRTTSVPQQQQMLYIIVFGYPPDKYSVTVEYFKSLGQTTEPDPNTEIVNCFKIGYYDPGDAMRAVRKSGEVLCGTWMVGAKWADAAQAEALLGQLAVRSALSTTPLPDLSGSQIPHNGVDESLSSQRTRATTTTPAVGTPIKLAPSALAFRKPGTSEKAPAIQQQKGSTGVGSISHGIGGSATGLGVGQSPGRGMVGQMSDLIFGW